MNRIHRAVATLTALAFLTGSNDALATNPPSAWADYFSGGRARVGERLRVPAYGDAYVMADQVVVQPGNAPSRHRYLVVISGAVARQAEADWRAAITAPRPDPLRMGLRPPPPPPRGVPRPPLFGREPPPATDLASRLADPDAAILLVEVDRDGTVRAVGAPTSMRNTDTWCQGILDNYLSRVMEATEEGRRLDAQARRTFEQFAARADATRTRYMTPQGYARIAGDIAVAGFQPRASQRLGPVGNFISETLQASGVAAVGSMDILGTPSQPPFGPAEEAAVTAARRTAEAVGNNRAEIREYLRQRLGMPRGGNAPLTPQQRSRREEVLTNLAIQFAGRMAAQGEGVTPDAVATEALAAIEDIAVEYALPRVPVVTVLARDALELTRQLRGFLSVMSTANRADERYTTAVNAFHESYACRQYFAQQEIARATNFNRMIENLQRGADRDPLERVGIDGLLPWTIETPLEGLNVHRNSRAPMGPPSPLLPSRGNAGPAQGAGMLRR